MKSIKKNKLPTVPSELIQVALKDLEKVQKLKTYMIDMDTWHRPGKIYNREAIDGSQVRAPKRGCVVCFAGSVMSRTFKVPASKNTAPGCMDISIQDNNGLKALNCFRQGAVHEGILTLVYPISLESESFPVDRIVPEFKGKGTRFKAAMRKLAKELKAVGL